MQLTGSEIFVEALRREGVDTIFALPGGVVLKIFDVLHQQKDIRVILTRHEQGAGHMAEGYAKATGKAGVCLITSGPGMTNVITALADAYMDSVPVVAFSGQVPTPFYDANDGLPSELLLNDGTGQFTQGIEGSGLERFRNRRTFRVSFVDLDEDQFAGDQPGFLRQLAPRGLFHGLTGMLAAAR